MKELIIYGILSFLTLISCIAVGLFGFIKESQKLKLTSLFLLIIGVASSAWTAYSIINKTSDKLADTFKPRTGDEIYDALFKKRETDCVEVLNYQDQIIPKIDYAIWLHFKCCPMELERILTQHHFKKEKHSTQKWSDKTPFSENVAWFNPAALGDSIIVYEYTSKDYKNIQTIWTNLDSTEVFVRDIYD